MLNKNSNREMDEVMSLMKVEEDNVFSFLDSMGLRDRFKTTIVKW